MPTTLRPRGITATDCINYQERLDREWRQLQQSIVEAYAESLARTVQAQMLYRDEFNPVPPPEPVSPPEESAYQELDRVTSARAYGRVRLNPVYQSRWTIQAEQPEPASPKRKKISNLSVLAEAERKLKGCL